MLFAGMSPVGQRSLPGNCSVLTGSETRSRRQQGSADSAVVGTQKSEATGVILQKRLSSNACPPCQGQSLKRSFSPTLQASFLVKVHSSTMFKKR